MDTSGQHASHSADGLVQYGHSARMLPVLVFTSIATEGLGHAFVGLTRKLHSRRSCLWVLNRL